MNLLRTLKETVLEAKNLVKEDSFDSLLWIVNIVPNMVGFSSRKEGKISVWFWIVHLSLLIYVYTFGCFWFQWKHAQSTVDFVRSNVSISVVVLTANQSWWFIMQRPFLIAALKKIDKNDKMSVRSTSLKHKHKQLMKTVKRIVLIFYGFNYFNGFFIHLPYRIDVMNTNAMTPCVGLEPLTASPNREVCLTLLAVQELTIIVVVLNYQALLLFLIAHTAAMYQMLAYEMMALRDDYNSKENMELVKQTLSLLVDRHSLTMEVVDRLNSLYSVPIGVNFCTNAVCLCLFFFLPLQEWLQFMPLMVYCFVVFFLYCFLGQKLTNSSEVFERTVYCCGWEDFDMKEKRIVLVMLRQTQKRVELLAANTIPVNVYTFATTLQAMYKFVTVLKF